MTRQERRREIEARLDEIRRQEHARIARRCGRNKDCDLQVITPPDQAGGLLRLRSPQRATLTPDRPIRAD